MSARNRFENRLSQENITSMAGNYGNLTGCNSASAREAVEIVFRGVNIEEMIPGPFVVMQGTPGDGMANTIDSMPMLMETMPYNDESDATRGGDGSSSLSIPSDLPNEIPNLSVASAQSSHASSMESNINAYPLIDAGSNHGSDGALVVVMGNSMTSDSSSTEDGIGASGISSATTTGIGTPRISNVEANNSFQSRSQIDRGLHLVLPASAVNVTAMGLGYNSFIPPIVNRTPDKSETSQSGRNLVSNATTAMPKCQDSKISTGVMADSFIFVDEKDDDSNKEIQFKDSPKRPLIKSSHIESSSLPNIDIGTSTSRESNPHYSNLSLMDQTAIQQWKKTCREEEELKRAAMLENMSSSSTNSCHDSSFRQGYWWTTTNRCLAVFESLPSIVEASTQASTSNPNNDEEVVLTALGNHIKVGRICDEIPPGTTVLATEIHYLDESLLLKSEELTQSDNLISRYQLLKIESPTTGFIMYSANGFCYLGAGLPTAYVEPEVWLWRVMCPSGAFVRQGLELTSVHKDTIPYGSIVRVRRKTINSMGLSRLHIETFLPSLRQYGNGLNNTRMESRIKDDNTQNLPYRHVMGWVSEALNPLSGQRGNILQPIPFPVPARYCVTLTDGAVIRSGIELSSPQIGHAPIGTILTVVGRGFSEHPADRCLERLKLAGAGGWISVRLNCAPPLDYLVVEKIGIDGSFDPKEAGLYHLQKQREVLQECNNVQNETETQNIEIVRQRLQRLSSTISTINDDDDDDQYQSTNLENSGDFSKEGSSLESTTVPTLYRSGVASGSIGSLSMKACGSKSQKDEHCLICLTESRTATIVHGETGHIACCLTCARILKARGDKCPVCRLPIDIIIQQFWA